MSHDKLFALSQLSNSITIVLAASLNTAPMSRMKNKLMASY